ncbi:hypothetical protein GW17_00060396, partial [Ensete ventricosum]
MRQGRVLRTLGGRLRVGEGRGTGLTAAGIEGPTREPESGDRKGRAECRGGREELRAGWRMEACAEGESLNASCARGHPAKGTPAWASRFRR